jgi:hypothetical protein
MFSRTTTLHLHVLQDIWTTSPYFGDSVTSTKATHITKGTSVSELQATRRPFRPLGVRHDYTHLDRIKRSSGSLWKHGMCALGEAVCAASSTGVFEVATDLRRSVGRDHAGFQKTTQKPFAQQI